jgi:Tfp pilus assembly protein PilV
MRAQQGISFIEILLTLVLLGAVILPITLLLGQTSQNSKGTFVQSTRSLVLSSLMDEMSPARPTYYTLFNDSAKNTSISESGQTIAYLRKVDTGASNALTRTTYFYVYNNATDPAASPYYKSMLTHTADELRIRCGSASGLIDSANQPWQGDGNAYSAANKQPGYVTGSSGTTGSNVVDIVNTDGNDDGIFQYYREGTGSTQVNYSFDVANDQYTVDLYFAELNAAVTGSAPNRRLIDIYIEGILKNTSAYSPYETTGGANRGNIQSFDVTVADGVLNASIRRNASSNHDARISGIVVRKRRMQ